MISTAVEGLWLNHVPRQGNPRYSYPCVHMHNVFSILSRLRCLQYLAINGWSVGYVEDYESQRKPYPVSASVQQRSLPLAIAPSPSLRSLSLSFGYLSAFPPAYAEWLFRPRNDYKLQRISLHLRKRRDYDVASMTEGVPYVEAPHVQESIIQWLGDTPVVHFRVDYRWNLVTKYIVNHSSCDSFGEEVPGVVSEGMSAKDLRLQAIGCPLKEPLINIVLPSSIEELHVRLSRTANSNGSFKDCLRGLDRALSLILTQNHLPCLIRVTLTYDRPSWRWLKEAYSCSNTETVDMTLYDDEPRYPQIRAICEARNVEFAHTDNTLLYHLFMME